MSFQELFRGEWNSEAFRTENKKFKDKIKESKFYRQDQKRLKKMWEDSNEVNFQFDLEHVHKINLSGQNPPTELGKKKNKTVFVLNHSVLRKCNDLMILICYFVISS